MSGYPATTPILGIPLLQGSQTNDWRQIDDALLAIEHNLPTTPGLAFTDPIVRDTLSFGAEPAGAADVILARTAPGALRVDTNLGQEQALPATLSANHVYHRLGRSGLLMADRSTQSVSSLFVTNNLLYNGAMWTTLVNQAGALMQIDQTGGLHYQTTAAAAPGVSVTLAERLNVNANGAATLSPAAGQTGLTVNAGAGTDPALLGNTGRIQAQYSFCFGPGGSMGANTYFAAGLGWRQHDPAQAGFMCRVDTNNFTWYTAPAGAGTVPLTNRMDLDLNGAFAVTQVNGGRLYLQPGNGSTVPCELYCGGGSSDTNGYGMGRLAFQDGSGPIFGHIQLVRDGPTAGSRGGTMYFGVKADGGAVQQRMMLRYGTASLDVSVGAQQGTFHIGSPGLTAHTTLWTDVGQDIVVAPASQYFRPDNDANRHLGHTSYRWYQVYAQIGTINTSSAAVKQSIAALDPAAAMAAVRATVPVRFDYRPPAAARTAPVTGHPFDWRGTRDALRSKPLEDGARRQHGFVLDDPQFPCHPLFATGKGQSSPQNTAGILLAAIKQLDARLSALETP